MCKIVLNIVKELGCGTKLVAQRYDGDAKMAGEGEIKKMRYALIVLHIDEIQAYHEMFNAR